MKISIRPKRKKRPAISHDIGLIFQDNTLGLIAMDATADKPRVSWCELRSLGSEGCRETFLSLLSERKIKHVTCVSVLPMDQYDVFIEEMVANIPREEQTDALRWNVVERLDYPSSDALIESFEQPSPPRSGSKQMAYVIATHQKTVQDNVHAFYHRGQSRITGINIHELALRNIATLLPEDKDGVALLHLRGSSGLLTVTRDKTLYLARKIEIGLDHIFEYLNENHADGDTEEILKHCSLLDEICNQVQSTLDYYLSRFMPNTIERLYLAPLEQPLEPLRAALSDRLAVRVKNINLEELFDFIEPIPDERTLGKLFPAFGVRLSCPECKQQINLFDSRFIPKIELATANQIMATLAASLLLVLLSWGILYGYLSRGETRLANEKIKLARMETRVGELVQRYPVQKMDTALEKHIGQIEGQILMKKLVVQILQGSYDFGNTHGFSIYFKELSRKKLDGIWISRMRILNGGEQFGLYGKAMDPKTIPAMVSLFQQDEKLSGHAYDLIKMEKNGIVEFSLLTHPMDEKNEDATQEKNLGLLQPTSPFSFMMEKFVEKALSGIIGTH
ncbi:MAG: hypothetical protein HQL07_18320 [Nitrospirae bacterium]|nr:hypothetical protein [Magnetococcales bacterium]HAT51619.1 hypothetical protein [Alphaproteobacteria bacterium]